MATERLPDRDHSYDERVLVDLVPCCAGWSRPGSRTLTSCITTARHVVASYAERNDRVRDRSRLLAEALDVESPSEDVLRRALDVDGHLLQGTTCARRADLLFEPPRTSHGGRRGAGAGAPGR